MYTLAQLNSVCAFDHNYDVNYDLTFDSVHPD